MISLDMLKDMTKKQRIWLFSLSGLLIILILAYIGYLSIWDEKPAIYIAGVGPMTGRDGKDGQDMANGIRIYLDEINKSGGVDGHKIELLMFDDQNNDAQARAMAIKASQSPATAVIGHCFSSISKVGGEIYKEYGVPAVTPAATAEVITDNDWYFRTVPTTKAQSIFLANYVYQVMGCRNASVIYDRDEYGASLAENFGKAFVDLGGSISYIWSFKSDDKRLDEIFSEFIQGMKNSSSGEIGTILLATQANEAEDIITLLRRNNISVPIMSGDAISSIDFAQRFGKYFEEITHPGYFTDGIFATSPIMFDVAGEEAQKFRNDYVTTYGVFPSWVAATSYDAAAVIVAAIKKEMETGDSWDDLRQIRKKMRNHIASFNKPQRAITGLTDEIYFDDRGDMVKPISIGYFQNQLFISGMTQLQPLSKGNCVIDLNNEFEAGRTLIVGDICMYKTNIVYTGIKVNEIKDVSLENFICTVDFNIWFRYQGDVDVGNIKFVNAVKSIELGDPVESKRVGNASYRSYHVVGEFIFDFHTGYQAFGKHDISVSFHHRTLNRNNLIYVSDMLGLNMSDPEQLMKDHAINLPHEWKLLSVDFYQSAARKSSLGDPEQLSLNKRTDLYSQFNANLPITKNEFTLRGLLPSYLVKNLLVICLLVTILLWRMSRKLRDAQENSSRKKEQGLSTDVPGLTTPQPNFLLKIVWLFQIIFTILILLTGEVVLINYLTKKIDAFSLEIIIRIFDILWWLIPASLLSLIMERFLWASIERKTGQQIPNILRHAVTFMIYLLAVSGIVAFVFDQKITSLLATSGMVAMIIGLAIQINISNIFSGIAINIEKPFRIGDWVKIGDYDEGQVVDVTWRSTRIQTWYDNIVSIPNSVASESVIHNFNFPNKTYWIWLTIQIDPCHPPDRVKKILMDSALSVQGVTSDPAPEVHVTIAVWSVDYTVAFCVQDYSKRFEYESAIWKAMWYHLDHAGIALGTESREVYTFQGEKGDPQAKNLPDPSKVLESMEIFDIFSIETKRILSQRMRLRNFQPGDMIVEQGNQGDSMFVIVEGSVGILVTLPDGKVIEVARRSIGDIMGEMALLTGEVRSASISALTETKIYELTKDDIAPFIKKNPRISERLSEILTQRKLETDSKKIEHQESSKRIQKSVYTQILKKIRHFFL
ncbi:MAG: hypothetical protein B6244_13700 [Candidatus Cloacimonetes bacterium 4572_55]|nr:MAG: hypothetical protein B6244_13700 [Candidatus Cloacimonetes bacterium 4572_55]